MAHAAPLNYEASAGSTHLQISNSLPPDVIQCLKNARFLHLATCTALHPHVSLMNYTYLPSTPYSPNTPTIVMTTNPTSKKTQNLVSNPNVSLLVHDWVSHRPRPTATGSLAPELSSSPPREGSLSSLAAMLTSLNTQALSSISASINGTARLVERGTEEEAYLRSRHLENNTFGAADGDGGTMSRAFGTNESESDGGTRCFIEGEEVRVVVVKIKDGRVADWKGGVRDWALRGEMEATGGEQKEETEILVNGEI